MSHAIKGTYAIEFRAPTMTDAEATAKFIALMASANARVTSSPTVTHTGGAGPVVAASVILLGGVPQKMSMNQLLRLDPTVLTPGLVGESNYYSMGELLMYGLGVAAVGGAGYYAYQQRAKLKLLMGSTAPR